MPALGPFITQVLTYFGLLMPLVQAIWGKVQRAAQESVPFAIQSAVNETLIYTGNATYGTQAIKNALDTGIANILTAVQNVRTDTATPHLATVQDVLDALAAGVTVITLPSPPPSGYGGPAPSDVWAETYQSTGVSFADLLARAGTESWHRAYWSNIPLVNAPWFTFENIGRLQTGLGNPVPTNMGYPQPDYSLVANYPTVTDWLNGTDTWHGGDWATDATSGTAYVDITYSGSFLGTVRCRLTPADWALITGAVGNASLNVPPVWPGAGLVTLGSAVALSSLMTIAGPLDGVLVNLSAPPDKLGEVGFGSDTYYYRLGFITFETDLGELEPWQYLGFDNAIYCPRQMKTAAACRIRYLGNAAGTVQPWTVT